MEMNLEELKQILADDWKVAWRIYYYICRHPELRTKLDACHQNTKNICILHYADHSHLKYEKAVDWVEFMADLHNSDHGDRDFVPSRKQLRYFSRYPHQKDLEHSVKMFKQLEKC